MEASHLLYIDDSGTKEYAAQGEAYSDRGGKSRHFVFGGVLIPAAAAGSFVDRIVEAKRQTFGTDAVEIKSTWLRNPAQREKRYLAPFRLSAAGLVDFVGKFYDIISDTDLKLIAAVVDKQHMQEDYRNPWYTPAVAYDLLLQRVSQEDPAPNAVAVYMDDMMGATPKGRQYKDNLRLLHNQLVRDGSNLLRGKISFRSILPNLRFLNSAHSHQVQAADIIAYNVYRQFTDHGDAWEEAPPVGGGELPAYKWFEKITPKFRQGPNRRIQGYGVAKMPLRNRVGWKITD